MQGDETGWERSWKGHQAAQLRRLARLPLAEKLTWLEEAHVLARHLSNGTPDRAPASDHRAHAERDDLA
jgi:hypothetical protein